MTTDHPTGIVAQVGAIANRSKNESGEGVADTETVIAKVGMVEMTTPESVPTMVTATMILEANDGTELFDLAHQRMGLSQRVFSVLLAFQFSSLPSPRVSGQNYDSIVLHLKEQNHLIFTLPPSIRVSMRTAHSAFRYPSTTTISTTLTEHNNLRSKKRRSPKICFHAGRCVITAD